MLPLVAKNQKRNLFPLRSLFGTWSTCTPACSCVVCHFHACFDVFSLVLTVLFNSRATFCDLRRYSHITLKMELYLFLGIALMCYLKSGLYRVRKMPITISKQKLGPYWYTTVFVEAPTVSGRISPLKANWICGDGHLPRAMQVPPTLLTF